MWRFYFDTQKNRNISGGGGGPSKNIPLTTCTAMYENINLRIRTFFEEKILLKNTPQIIQGVIKNKPQNHFEGKVRLKKYPRNYFVGIMKNTRSFLHFNGVWQKASNLFGNVNKRKCYAVLAGKFLWDVKKKRISGGKQFICFFFFGGGG